ncbi:MAG: signal peptide peptidase SppA [Microscillaceae bacterium]|nr:signal peptide peptidase SppA [Microscillaceae bacterium]
MLQFLKFTLATIVGIFLFFLIGFLSLTLLIPDDSVSIDDNSVLHLTLNQPILERSVDNPFSELEIPISDGVYGIGLIELKENILKAKEDKKIKGIFLELSSIMTGFAVMEELRDVLLDFKKSGKFIYAYSEAYSEGAYYLASTADQIYLNPAGGMEFNGLSLEIQFFRKALDKLSVKPIVFRVGDFKSAVEPYTLDKMSEENRTQLNELINSMYDHYLSQVAKARKLNAKQLEQISDEMRIREPKNALEYKLVDKLAYYPEVESELKKKLKLKEKSKINFFGIEEYLKTEDKRSKSTSSNRIAVIVASGVIQSGNGDDAVIGSETIARELRKARKDDKIKAIVLRINSPGGSALASDVMWKEIQLTKKEKPVIASMSDYAASGGYYMAMGCNKIVAQPNTITGSIGVFGIFFNVQDLFSDKLGITSDRVSTGKFPEIRSALLDRELSDEEKEMLQSSTNKIYEDFTAKAAQGRKMSQDAIKKIASGRVWSGAQAKANGLIDEIGSLEDAILLAAKEAKLKEDDYRVRYYPTQKSFYDKVFEAFSVKTDKNIPQAYLKQELGPLYNYYLLLEKIKKTDYLQMQMPFQIVIH